MAALLPHQQRVVAERNEVAARMEKLAVFIIEDPAYRELHQAEKDRLNRQGEIMGQYVQVLDERIAAFGGEH